MRVIWFILLFSGVALLGFLVWEIGPTVVASSFSQLSWRLIVVLCFPFLLMTLFDTLGWRFAFKRDNVPFRKLLSVRLAGEAFNLTTPTASLGGEAVKAWLLRGHVPFEESLPSVIIAKTTITIAQGLFMVLGIVCAWATLPPGSPVLVGMRWLLILEVLAVGGFVLVQVKGLLSGGGRLLGRFGLAGLGERAHTLLSRGGALSLFYREEPRRLILSIGGHFVGWILGVLETYLILRFLGLPVSLTTATVIEAFGTGVRFATFFVPASLGALEGGQMATFVALGLGAASGLTFVLVRRVREATWAGIGLIALAGMRSAAKTSPALRPEG